MTFAALASSNQHKLNFQFQEIVNAQGYKQGWIEMLYRPNNLKGYPNVEKYFKALSTLQKVELDIRIFEQINANLSSKKPNRLSVNLMPFTLLSPQFRASFRLLMDHKIIDPNLLCIEIVESDSLPPLCSDSIDLLKTFRAQGGWIALDDFGTGFAHWELLQIELIDVIKVANQNLRHLGNKGFTYGLAKFARSLNITSVLEGVETEEDFINGVELGFDHFQGWHFNQEQTQ
ncbi:MAG: EAL domain-containing protein [Marinicella sp.]|nr:EAL domain-containing protein [Xanthomonadales bacterium]